MTETYHAGVYWPARLESAEQCARRAETFFRLLSQCDPVFEHWYEQADSLEEALQLEFAPQYETFLRFFQNEENQLGRDGFSLGAWTGQREDGRGGVVRLTCGDASGAYPNVCFLHLPSQEPEAERVLRVPVLAGILRVMVQAWEPAWGIVTSGDYRERMSSEGDPGTFVGWLTYYSRQGDEAPALPEPARVEPVEDEGTLVILTPERLSAHNPEHMALGHQVQALLDAKDLLRPVVP